MGYTNSKLVEYVNISPNRTSPRNHSIDRITPHCYVGQASVQSMGGWLCNSAAQASANYGIAQNGQIGMFVEEKDRSWCSSNRVNDNRAVTIECASDVKEPYTINDTVYNKLISLMTDICKRNGKNKILWFGDKDKTLAYQPKSNEMVITVHRWFANKACPGDYIYNRLGTIAKEINKRLGTVTVNDKASGIPGSKQDFITKVSKIAIAMYKNTQILPSVVIGQCCLETGYGLGADAVSLVEHNNLLGMKANLLNSTWKQYSVWNGEVLEKITPEVVNGKVKYGPDEFRSYTDYENCIQDYEMFLLHVKNDNGYKYRKVSGMTDPQEVISTISKGGYATDPAYITKVMKIITENDLTKYDKEVGIEIETPIIIPDLDVQPKPMYYRVQVGAFTNKTNAKKKVKQLQEVGFSPIIKKVNNIYKVQVGAFTKKANATKQLKEVKALGFTDAFITT